LAGSGELCEHGKAMSVRVSAPPAALLFVVLGACAPEEPREGQFVEVGASRGLPRPDPAWPAGTYFMPEIMQGGVGLFEADGDGDLDLVHVRIPPPALPPGRIRHVLYLQQADGSFRDAGPEGGLLEEGFGQGLAIGDTDNDGDNDLYLTNYGPDVFYTNDGRGRFTNATATAGLEDSWWGTSAAFGDVDGDGFLDLYVANYVRYDPEKRCTDPSERSEYCGPRSFHGAPDQLWRNEGDGTFRNVTQQAGVVLPQDDARGHGLGVVITDLTRDGRADIFVANDAQANQLWVNQGEGRFEDEGVARGVGLNRHGQTEANMGVAVGDVDGDLAPDLLVTHLWEEHNRLFLATKSPVFRDFTVESGLAKHDLERTGFGCGFLDFDHDGDQDLAVVNGAVRRRPPVPGAPDTFWREYVEPNQLFENLGGARFELVEATAGDFARDPAASRGLALGDVDGDGDVDLVVANLDNSLQLYENRLPAAGTHWLLVRVLTHGRDALGAQVSVQAGGTARLALALAGSSYCSSNDPRVHFGLGASASYEALEVLWPDGTRERFAGGAADREVRLVQGEGERR